MDRRAPLVLAVALLVAGAGAWAVSSLYRPLGEAPGFTLTSTGYENHTFSEPVAFNLTDYAGQTVVLDLMAIHCASCEIVTREVLLPLWQRYGDDSDFAMLSIDTWADPALGDGLSAYETEEGLIRLQQERGLAWRHALDTDDVWRKYAAVALPKLVVIDPEGRIVAEHHGVPRLAKVDADVRASMDGSAGPATGLRAPLLGMAAVAGVAAFFAPCSIGLVPAYFGMLLAQRRERAYAVPGGLAAAAGALSLYAVLGILLLAAAPSLAIHAETVATVAAVGLIASGLLMAVPRAWAWIARLADGRVEPRHGFFAFGAAFALASFACTGPVFLPILLGAFAVGPAAGLAAVALYGGTLAALMLLVAVLAASGKASGLARFTSRSRAIHQVCAVLFVVAGLYVLWFQQRAGAW